MTSMMQPVQTFIAPVNIAFIDHFACFVSLTTANLVTCYIRSVLVAVVCKTCFLHVCGVWLLLPKPQISSFGWGFISPLHPPPPPSDTDPLTQYTELGT